MSQGLPWALVQHASYEGPGLIEEAGTAHGVEFRTVRTYAGEALPKWRDIGGVVSMGGPMGVPDAGEFPVLEEEMGLLWVAVDQGLPVLGVCLGAQLLAAALGASVTHGKYSEYGCGTVTLTQDGLSDPVLGPAGETVPVLHWHSDTFGIPRDAVRLASSSVYRNQAFRAARHAYGLQFHVELTEDLAAGFAPHLPNGVSIDDADRESIAATGRGILDRYFAIATEPATVPLVP